MQNPGKIFEEQIKKSVPDYALLYRLPDAAQSFNQSNALRFSRKNPFDFLLWDAKRRVLYALELKTVKGKSISFERDKSENKEIHYHQICGLNEWAKYDGIVAGFIIEFRAIEITIFIDIVNFLSLIRQIEKKSFNIDDLDRCGVQYCVIAQTLLKTRYVYDIDRFLSNIKI